MFSDWMTFHEKHEAVKKQLETYFKKKQTNLNTYTVCYILCDQENQELRISDLAPRLSLSVSATSRLIAKLEEETGFIRRENCDIDNRGLYAVLTDAGRGFLEEVTAEVDQLLEGSL